MSLLSIRRARSTVSRLQRETIYLISHNQKIWKWRVRRDPKLAFIACTQQTLGACGGSCACSTCHITVEDPDMYDKMPEPDDDENDMLDLAFGLTETSRLGCQVKMAPELDGLRVKLPSMTRNLQASDFSRGKKG